MSTEYRPLKELEIFISDHNGHFIVAKHTSHANVKISLGYSSTYVYVSNYQAHGPDSEKRIPVYLDALMVKYEQLKDASTDDDIDWPAIYNDTINTLEELRGADWARLGRELA